jgi:hypothetical protein
MLNFRDPFLFNPLGLDAKRLSPWIFYYYLLYMYKFNMVENFNLLTQQMHETPPNTTMGSISYLFRIPTTSSPYFYFITWKISFSNKRFFNHI